MKKASVQRQTRIRRKIAQTTDRPRLTVTRSNNYCYAQVIDVSGNAMFGLSEKTVLGKNKVTPTEGAKQLGLAIAKLASEKKVKEVVFDKGRFAYHGRVKAVAEGAREGGLQF